MRKMILLIGVLVVSPFIAHAQNADSRSRSGAQAVAIVEGGGGSNGGSGTQRLVTAPPIAAPSVFGANPCSVGGSGGGSWLGTGIVFGASFDGTDCRLQEWFRMLNMAGQPNVAKAMVCRQNAQVRQAYADAGDPCPQDRVAVVAPVPVAQEVAARPARQLPAYCNAAGRVILNPECQ